MTNTVRFIDTLPSSVAVKLSIAISTLKDTKDALEQGRRADQLAGSPGRFEADVILDRFKTIEALFESVRKADQVIQYWDNYAKERSIELDMELLLNQEGCPGVDEICVSKAGVDYLADTCAPQTAYPF